MNLTLVSKTGRVTIRWKWKNDSRPGNQIKIRGLSNSKSYIPSTQQKQSIEAQNHNKSWHKLR